MIDITNQERISEILNKNDGTISSLELTKNGIPRFYLQKMVQENRLEKVERGIYITPETWEDNMFILQLRYPKAIFSHETALFLHELTERTPSPLSITVPNNYYPKNLFDSDLVIFRSIPELYDLGITEGTTNFGKKVKVYNPEKTLCDIVKSKNKCDEQQIPYAFKEYFRRGNYKVHLLMEYARLLRVEKTIQNYLKILL